MKRHGMPDGFNPAKKPQEARRTINRFEVIMPREFPVRYFHDLVAKNNRKTGLRLSRTNTGLAAASWPRNQQHRLFDN